MRVTTRLKKTKQMIRMVRPMELTPKDLINPIFVREDGRKFEIPSMKGQQYLSLDDAVEVCRRTVESRIPAVMVYGVLKEKDADGSMALRKDGFHARVFRTLKKEMGDDLVLISNLCLCDHTLDEICIYTDQKGRVMNEKTAEMLGKIAVVHAEAGADVIAPAGMVDGQVAHIRSALDREGFDDVAVMAYVKTDTCLFQPFFETMTLSKVPTRAQDPSKFRTDVINAKMYMQKVDLDVSEGADIVIVKPALTNLDLMTKVKEAHPTIPIAAYQVSGEYAMIKLLSEYAHVNEDAFLLETLSSIKRAGADTILTYHALQAAAILRK
jgi:porphobilinogen synthase